MNIVVKLQILIVALLVGLAISIAQSPMARAESGERWTHECETDEMTDEKWCVASSPLVLGNPYHSSSLAMKCWDYGHVEVYTYLDYINLTKGEFEQWPSGKVVRKLGMLVRYDDEKASYANFYVDDSFSSWVSGRWEAMRKIIKHNVVKIQYPFYRDGNVVVTYNLAGANDAIRASLTGCGIESTRLNEPSGRE